MSSAKADLNKLKPFIVFSGAKHEVEALNKEFQLRCIVPSLIKRLNERGTHSKLRGKGCRKIFYRSSFVWRMGFIRMPHNGLNQTIVERKQNTVIVPGGCT